MGRRDHDDERPKVLESLKRRTSSGTSTGSRTSPSAFHRRVSNQSQSTRSTSTSTTRRDSLAGSETPPPLMRSSPSVGSSSYAFSGSSVLSPLRRELDASHSRDGGDVRAGKLELARRLSKLASRLTYGDSMEELMALGSQVNQIEQALGGGINTGSVYGSPPLSRRPRPLNIETPVRKNRGSDLDGSAIFSSPSSLFRSRFPDQMSPTPSSSMMYHGRHDEFEEEEAPPPKNGMTAAQSNKIIGELVKLNEELDTVVSNLTARQEESDHIHRLLVERAERAAQRIIFLQNRITYLEEELQENDNELTNLRVCLKAVEIQLPEHPDKELQRSFSVFKEGYRAYKRKRALRSKMVSNLGYDSSIASSSSAR
ncbi:hypothetical protein MKX08_007475 [Trichoderma sp. CBMAI-0020]|nr:hypothetical protein MKX08_007475 [Trichoderma sp. CBMAI-0020]